MQTLSASELLSIWEQGQGQSPITKALLLLVAALPDQAPAKLSIGRRDSLLLTLRERLFGSRLVSIVVCPQCSQNLELAFDVAAIRAAADDDQPESLTVAHGSYQAQFRLPNSEDLAAIAANKGAAASDMNEMLLSRCLLQVCSKGGSQSPRPVDSPCGLPPALIAAITEKMDQADPQANARLNLTCADCGHRWSSSFDIVSYLWSEIDDWAHRILREVHVLASAYGWRERDILTMCARRRQMYMQMLGV